jgi:hypothetical protein
MSSKIVVLFFGVQFGIIVGGDGADLLFGRHAENRINGVKAQTICWVVSIVTLFLGEMEKIILTVGPETTK